MPFISIPYPPKYPLTQQERKWLEERQDRELRHGHFSCIYCEHFTSFCDPYTGHCDGSTEDCPFEMDMRQLQDATVFEARVAAWLAGLKKSVPCRQRGAKRCRKTPYVRHCPACYLKHARLDVETMEEK